MRDSLAMGVRDEMTQLGIDPTWFSRHSHRVTAVVISLTGSAIVFHQELDRALNISLM